MSLTDGWVGTALKVLAIAAGAAGAGGFGVRQFDEGAPVRAERELAELRIEAAERAAMRDRCDAHLAQAREETRHFVERCLSLVEGRE